MDGVVPKLMRWPASPSLENIESPSFSQFRQDAGGPIKIMSESGIEDEDEDNAFGSRSSGVEKLIDENSSNRSKEYAD